MDQGSSPKQVYPLINDENEALGSHGLVSSIYAMAPSGEYITDDERALRTKNSLKALISKHGRPHVDAGLRAAAVPKSDETVLDALRHGLSLLPE
jgi:hypothetical protein